MCSYFGTQASTFWEIVGIFGEKKQSARIDIYVHLGAAKQSINTTFAYYHFSIQVIRAKTCAITCLSPPHNTHRATSAFTWSRFRTTN